MAFPEGWGYKWPIAINADSVISSPVADWPCLVTDAHFPAGAWAQMQATGADLRFSLDEDGATELYYDAPRLSVAGESAHLYVRVPSLASGADTTIYGWVGNAEATAPTAAWMQNTYPASIAAWWPMEEGSGTTVEDRTSNGYDATLTGTPTASWVVTPYGNGLRFGTGTDHLTVAADATLLALPTTGNWAVTCVVSPATSQVRAAWSWSGTDDLTMVPNRASGATFGMNVFWRDLLWSQAGESVVDLTNTWGHYAVMSRTLTDHRAYRDADLKYSSTNNAETAAGPFDDFFIGMFPAQNYAGDMASICITHGLSDDELSVHRLMLMDPATFASAGELVAVGGKRIIYPWHTPGFNAGFARL